MNTISNIGRDPRVTIHNNHISQPNPAASAPQAGVKDSASISENWQEQVNWHDETQKIIESLQKSFPKIEIFFSDKLGKEDLRYLAAAMGKGSHLILSDDFLEKMGSSKENFEAGKSALLNALKSLASHSEGIDGKGIYLEADKKMSWTAAKKEAPPLTQWQKEAKRMQSMLERMKEMEAESKERKEKAKAFRRNNSAADYQTAGTYAKLASAGSRAQVQWAMGEARRKIGNLRIASASGDADERRKAQAAIKAYQKLLMRGGRKIRRLTEEELTQVRKERAEKKEEYERAFRLKLEKSRQATKRKSADRMIVAEGKLHDLSQTVYTPYRRSKHVHRTGEFAPAAPITPSVPQTGTAAPDMGSSTDGSFTASDITITVESE